MSRYIPRRRRGLPAGVDPVAADGFITDRLLRAFLGQIADCRSMPHLTGNSKFSFARSSTRIASPNPCARVPSRRCPRVSRPDPSRSARRRTRGLPVFRSELREGVFQQRFRERLSVERSAGRGFRLNPAGPGTGGDRPRGAARPPYPISSPRARSPCRRRSHHARTRAAPGRRRRSGRRTRSRSGRSGSCPTPARWP